VHTPEKSNLYNKILLVKTCLKFEQAGYELNNEEQMMSLISKEYKKGK
jgi:hypothetical protein